MAKRHDFSTFTSRLHVKGQLTFKTGMRIGSSRSIRVDEPDLPVLRNALGTPYIPGSSLKGAFRSYTESILRRLQTLPTPPKDRNLACLVVGKAEARPQGEEAPHVCLHQNEVDALKSAQNNQWNLDGVPASLRERLPSEEALQQEAQNESSGAVLDRLLFDLSCWACRVFGAQWLASKVLFRDLSLVDSELWPTEIRDGVAIDRDSGRAAHQQKYQVEVLPAGASFDLDVIVENAKQAELGLFWLGINALRRGEIALGGATSRGLGWGQLEIDWDKSRWVHQENLLSALFTPDDFSQDENLNQMPGQWLQAFRQAIGLEMNTGGGDA